jgi:hypothetical protein
MGHDLAAIRQKMGVGGGKRIPPAKIIAWIEANFDYKTRKGGDEYCICNPFNGDSGFNFNINPDKCSCHDWRGDQWAGPINPETGKRNCSFVKFVKLYRKVSYPEAVREILGTKEDIRAFLRPEARHDDSKPVRKIAVALPEGTERIIDFVDRDPQAAMLANWLEKRGYTAEEMDRHELHYLAMNVYWPYFEFDDLVYWQSRNRFNKIYRFPDLKVYDKSGNQVGETEGSKQDFLYGFDDCEIASYLILTEAIFGQNTLGAQATATGGAVMSPTQVNKIRVLGPKKGIILSPDNDKAGIESVLSNATLLGSLGYPLYYSVPPKVEYMEDGKRKKTKDWNEFQQKLGMPKSEVRELHDKGITPVKATTRSRLIGMISRRD